MGGKETINSGATQQNNDFQIELFPEFCWGTWSKASGESKFTMKKSFSVTHELLIRTVKEARDSLPIVHLGFEEAGKPTDDYVILRAADFTSIIEFAREQMRTIESNDWFPLADDSERFVEQYKGSHDRSDS